MICPRSLSRWFRKAYRGQMRMGTVSFRRVADRAQIGFDRATHGLHRGLLDLQVGEGLCLDRELVRKAVALGLPSLVVRGAEL